MLFLTEDDVRARCPKQGDSLQLSAKERLTPSARELAARMRVTVVQGTDAAPAVAKPAAAAKDSGSASACSLKAAPSGACSCCEKAAESSNMTHLDAATMVSKGHPRIVLRGKLDSLLAVTVLVRTQFDPKDSLAGFLKTCLTDIHTWVMQVLTAEVSGNAPTISGMGGMDAGVLRAVSHDPVRYLGIDHYCPDAAFGGNAALLGWLRTIVREAEVAAVQCNLGKADITDALNRLSSAVYVLLLLTLAAEKGMAVTALKQ